MDHVLFYLREQMMDWLTSQPDICKLIDQKYIAFIRGIDEKYWIGMEWREYLDAIRAALYAESEKLHHVSDRNLDVAISTLTYFHTDLDNIECKYHLKGDQ